MPEHDNQAVDDPAVTCLHRWIVHELPSESALTTTPLPTQPTFLRGMVCQRCGQMRITS